MEQQKNSRCRLCLKYSASSGLFEKVDTNTNETIAEKIRKLVNIEILPSDGLPDKICSKCLKKLKYCIKFFLQCKKADKSLRSSLNKKTCNENDTPHKSLSSNDKDCMNNDLSQLNEKEGQIKPVNLFKKKRKAKACPCNTCGKVLSSSYRLKMHMRMHTGEKPHICTYCDKAFTMPENLNVHLRLHTGEKPFKCDDCGAKFAQSANFMMHKLKHTGQLPYPCTYCERRFRNKGHLDYHIRGHTGERNHVCSTCDQKFITASELKNHTYTHMNIKRFVCTICGQALSTSSGLKRHMLLHSKSKPYICELCKSRFIQNSDLVKHKVKVHGKSDSSKRLTSIKKENSEIMAVKKESPEQLTSAMANSSEQPTSACVKIKTELNISY